MSNQFYDEGSMKYGSVIRNPRTRAFMAMFPPKECQQCGRPVAFDPVIGSYRHTADRVLELLCDEEPEDA